MANVLGIEVSGTTYDIEDETARSTASSASSLATQASEDVGTLQTTVNNISDSVDRIADDLQTAEDNIGDLADLETTAKADLVSAVNEVNEKADEANKTSIFDFLTLVFGSYDGSTPLMGDTDEESFVATIPNYASYKGIAIVCGDSLYSSNSQSGRQQGKELKFLLKRADGSCEIQLMQFLGGERLVTEHQNIRVTSSGQITIYPGVAPKEDSDSDTTTSQYLFGVYAVYGIN